MASRVAGDLSLKLTTHLFTIMLMGFIYNYNQLYFIITMMAVNLISEHLDLMIDYSREKSVMDYTEETSFQPKHSWTTRAQVLQDRSQNKTDRPFF